MSRLLQGTWPSPGSPCFFWHASCIIYTIQVITQVPKYHVHRKSWFSYHFLGSLPWFHKFKLVFISCRFHKWSFCNLMQWKRIKIFFLQPVSLLANCNLHHFNTTIFCCRIIYVDVELCLFRWKNLCIRNIIYETDITSANVLLP